MHLTQICIHRPIATLMASLALIFLGMVSYRELPVQRMPDVSFPAIGYGAAVKQGDPSPEETNEMLTIPFEKMVASLPGVKEMQSSTSSGHFWGYATFNRGTDVRFRVVDLQNRVNKWLADKKSTVQAQVTAQSTEQQAQSLAQLVLSVPLGQESRIPLCTDLITRRLKSIDGITEVEISGNVAPNITLLAKRDEVIAKGIDERKILDAINKHPSGATYLGPLEDGQNTHQVNMKASIDSLSELLKIPVDTNGLYTLGMLTQPDRKIKEEKSIFRINGKKAVSISVNKEKDRNIIQVARLLRRQIADLRNELPQGFDLTMMRDEAESLEKMLKDMAKMAAVGAFLCMMVLLVFVRNWRVATIVSASIPVSILITFNAMYGAGLSINVLSLLGLSAGIGMLVDNSIVVMENVFRHSRLNKNPKEAAWLGSREVTRALLVSTVTNLIVFVPLLYVEEDMMAVLVEGALSLVFPMIISLGAAMTLIPMLASRVVGRGTGASFKGGGASLKGGGVSCPTFGNTTPRLSWSLLACLYPWRNPGGSPRNLVREFVFFCAKGAIRHPVRLVSFVLVLILLTMISGMIKIAIQRYGGPSKIEQLTLYGKSRAGMDLAETDRFFIDKEEQIRRLMADKPQIKSFSSTFDKTGGTISLEIAPEYQTLKQNELTDEFSSLKSGNDFSGFRFQPFREAEMIIQNAGGRGMTQRFMGGSGAERVQVVGENTEAMMQASDQVKKLLQRCESVQKEGIVIESNSGDPEIHFQPDMALFQIMKADVSSLQTFFQTREEQGLQTSMEFQEGALRRAVTLKVVPYGGDKEKKVRQTLNELKALKVPLQGGGFVTLSQLGRFSIRSSVPSITKKNRQRNMGVSFSFIPTFYKEGMERTKQDELRRIEGLLKDMRFPAGISANMASTLEETRKQTSTWKLTLGLAAILLYLVMAFFFESLTMPGIIMLTLPLAAIGGVWGIIIFKAELNEVALLGSIILAGVVPNNAILLIEYIRQMQQEKHYRRSRALLYAVSYRLRPILMTSLTTILGLVPILFSSESPREARSLVAVFIGGMITSAMLTLAVIPTCYNVLAIGFAALKRLILRKREEARAWFHASPRRMPRLLPAPQPPIRPLEPCIRIDNVSKIYPAFAMRKLLNFIPSRTHHYGCRPARGKTAVYHLDLTIESGMFGLLGPNGAGKTTLMKILTGVIPSSFGTVTVAGYDLRTHREKIRSLISYLPQNFGVYGSLTLDEYLNFFAPFYGLNDRAERKRLIGEIAEMVGLGEVRNKPMKRFSGGMRQRAGIAQMLLKPCPIMIVDEPTAGLDPVERVRFRLLLSQLAHTRIVILSTHIVDDITSSCQRIAVLNNGEIIYQGDLEQIKTRAAKLIWDYRAPADAPVEIANRNVLYKKHEGDQVLYHYVSTEPLPGSIPVDPNFEDAYVALLLKHDQRRAEEKLPRPLQDRDESTPLIWKPVPLQPGQ